MSYYTRILSPSTSVVSVDKLQTIIAQQSLKASIAIETGTANDSTSLVLTHNAGPEIASLETNSVADDTLGSKEIAEFLEEITNCKPISAVKWLSEYLPKVKSIYPF